jgi:hypothetical protein
VPTSVASAVIVPAYLTTPIFVVLCELLFGMVGRTDNPLKYDLIAGRARHISLAPSYGAI